MADVVICGAGVCGLVTAMLLADDGHTVTVVERDDAGAPDIDDVWHGWQRRGVTQFQQPHLLLSRFLNEVRKHLPRLEDALVDAGALQFNFLGPFRDAVPGGERFDAITARRPVVEAAVAGAAAATPGITIRRGVAIAGLTTGASTTGRTATGVPHVVGVRTEAGEQLGADLVVVAAGRRSPLDRWLEAIGTRPPHTETEDSGFVYYGAYVASPDGEQPLPTPMLVNYGSIELLALPADRGTAGIGIIATGGDAALRGLRSEAAWRRVLASLPVARSVAGLPLINDLRPMAGIEDVRRRLVADGMPVATGVVAVADAWAATNPTLGRGISFGTMHAVALRDAVRASLDDPSALVVDFDQRTEAELGPWYEATVWQDRFTVADMKSEAGLGPPPDDERWTKFRALSATFRDDLDLAVKWADASAALSSPPQTLLDDPDVAKKLEGMTAEPRDHGGPSRDELLALVAG